MCVKSGSGMCAVLVCLTLGRGPQPNPVLCCSIPAGVTKAHAGFVHDTQVSARAKPSQVATLACTKGRDCRIQALHANCTLCRGVLGQRPWPPVDCPCYQRGFTSCLFAPRSYFSRNCIATHSPEDTSAKAFAASLLLSCAFSSSSRAASSRFCRAAAVAISCGLPAIGN